MLDHRSYNWDHTFLGAQSFYFCIRQPGRIVEEALNPTTKRNGIQMADAKQRHRREIMGGARRSRISPASRQRTPGRTIAQKFFCEHSICTHAPRQDRCLPIEACNRAGVCR